MTREFLMKLREWVQAEAEYAVAGSEEDEEGYRYSAHAEQKVADKLFNELLKMEEA